MPALLCPGCSRKLNVPVTLSGKEVRCPACSAELSVPLPEASTVPPVARPAGETETVLPASPAGSDSAATVSPADPNATVPPTMGRVVGQGDQRAPADYEVLGELGRGGMGVVYKARHRKLNRVVALKMILSGAHAGEDEMKRFATEAEAIARLQHPGIVQVYEVGEHDGRPYFALEFCPGGALDRKLAGTPMQPKDAAKLVQKLAEAMHEAHDARVIHRDLKPANVLMGADGAPKVTDFGLAKKLDEQGQTVDGAIMGTPSYMAPEQASGAKDIGPPADVYALGAILYECLTGRPPFRAATPFDTIVQVVSEEPVPLRQLNAKVPGDLETIALKCLSKEPAKRFGSASELGRDLERFVEGRPIRARPVGAAERGVKWVRRNRAVSALAALVFVAMATGTTASLMFGMDARDKAGKLEEQTGQLKTQAEELTKERNAAKESEKKARESEGEKSKALEEVETTFAESLLRLLGHKRPHYDMEGRNRLPLDSLEAEAVRKLERGREKRASLLVLETELQDPASAVRLGRRADVVIQAMIGLSPERRRQAEALVVRRTQQSKDDAIALACARLGLELNCRDQGWAGQAAEALVRAIAKAAENTALRLDNGHSLLSLTRSLLEVNERLESSTARSHASSVGKTLVTGVTHNTNDHALEALAGALTLVVEHLEAEEAATCASKAAATYAASIPKANGDPDKLHHLSEGLKVVCKHLEPREAAARAETASEAIVAALAAPGSFSRDAESVHQLALSFVAILPYLNAKVAAGHSSKVAGSILNALEKAEDDEEFNGLSAVWVRLSQHREAQLSPAVTDRAKQAATRWMAQPKDDFLYEIAKQSLKGIDSRLAAQKARAILSALRQTVDSDKLRSDLMTLRALSEALRETDAKVVAEESIALFSPSMDSVSLICVVAAFCALLDRLDANKAAPLADRVAAKMIRALDNTTEFGYQVSYATGLATVSQYQNARRAGESAAHLMTTVHKLEAVSFAGLSENDHPLLKGLQISVQVLPTTELVLLLAHPFCVGPTQRAVLSALGNRCKRNFRNSWHFIDWAETNGVDWRSEVRADSR